MPSGGGGGGGGSSSINSNLERHAERHALGCETGLQLEFVSGGGGVEEGTGEQGGLHLLQSNGEISHTAARHLPQNQKTKAVQSVRDLP